MMSQKSLWIMAQCGRCCELLRERGVPCNLDWGLGGVFQGEQA